MRLAGSNATRGPMRAAAKPRTSTFLAPEPVQDLVTPDEPPTFSVVIAAYQAADVIGEAIASALQQTVKPLQIIVCDDGSTDDLERALAPFRNDIVFVRKENGGEGSAKNAAAAAATGDFVTILDADDVYLPERLARLSDLARARPDLDILTTDGILVAAERHVRHVYDRSWRFETANQRSAILQRNFIFGLAAVRRSRLHEHGGFDESIRWTTDWDLWLRMILAGSRAGCVDEPLALYRLREESLTSRRRELQLGKLATLTKASANPNLLASERPTLDRAIASTERGLALLDLRNAVAAGAPGARKLALRVLFARGHGARARISALAAAVVPRAAGRVVRARDASSWTGAAGIRVSRDDRTD